MATNYPGALDSYTNPTSTDTLDSATVPHATQHTNLNDAVVAVETALGTNLSKVAALAVANTFTQPQTANSFIVTSSTVPTNGIYLPATDTLGLSTASTVRLRIDSSGNIGIGNVPLATAVIRLAKSVTGGTSAFTIYNAGTVQSDVTSDATYYRTNVGTAATTFTLSNLYHYDASQGTIGAGSTVTNQTGFVVQSSLIGATNNFGFSGKLAAATGSWNVYMNGTAANYFAGQTTVGSTSLTLGSGSVAQQFGVVAGAATTVGQVIRGAASQTANLQEWQNSAGTVFINVSSAGDLSANAGLSQAARFRYFDGPSINGAYIDTILATGTLGVVARSTSAVTFVVKGAASQTANLQQWQNSSATVLTAVTSAGTINFASGNTAATATAGAITAPALVTGYITMQIAGTTVKIPYYSN
jgi:hypothetical protein